MKQDQYIKLIIKFRNDGFGVNPDFENANFVMRKGKGIFINRIGVEIINKLIIGLQNDLKNDGLIDKKNLEKYFFDNCFTLFIENDISEELIKDKLNEFLVNTKEKIKEKHTIIIPITGLRLKGGFDLLNFKIISGSQLKKEYKNYFLKNTIGKEQFKKLVYSGDSFAITVDIGDPKSLVMKQIESLDSALNLIRLYIPLFWFHSFDVQISIVNQDYVTLNSAYVLCENILRYVSSSVVRRPLIFDIDKKRMHSSKYSQRKEMRNWNYDKLNYILNNNNNISNTILNSLHWIGLYTKEKNINLKFLYLIFSLEGLLTNENNNYSSITAAVSEKIAFLLAEKKDNRLELFDFVKEMYGKRGGIVHGSGTIIKSSELTDMYQIVLRSFYKLADLIEKYDIKTTKELNKKMTEIKFE